MLNVRECIGQKQAGTDSCPGDGILNERDPYWLTAAIKLNPDEVYAPELGETVVPLTVLLRHGNQALLLERGNRLLRASEAQAFFGSDLDKNKVFTFPGN